MQHAIEVLIGNVDGRRPVGHSRSRATLEDNNYYSGSKSTLVPSLLCYDPHLAVTLTVGCYHQFPLPLSTPRPLPVPGPSYDQEYAIVATLVGLHTQQLAQSGLIRYCFRSMKPKGQLTDR